MKIIEEETKKAGLLLAAIGIILGILFNLFITQQQILGAQVFTPKQDTSTTAPLTIFIALLDYHIIFAEAALLLLSAVCLVAVLAKTTRQTENRPVIDYEYWMGKASAQNDQTGFENFLIRQNEQSIKFFDKIISESKLWYQLGIFALLVSIVYLVLVLILILYLTTSIELKERFAAIITLMVIGTIIGAGIWALIFRIQMPQTEPESKTKNLYHSP